MNLPRHARPHDRLTKAVFGRPEGARALLRAALPREVVAELDLDTLQVVPGNLLTDGMREKFADLLFECSARSGPVVLHVLLEHKSGSARFTVLDLFVSAGAIWDDWRRRHPRAKQVPRILPVVLHHGARPWSAPVDLAPLLAGDLAPTPLAALDPTFPILLIDLAANAQCIDDAGDQDPLAGAALWVLRWARARDFLDRLATGRAFLLRLDRDPHGEEHLNLVLNYLVFVTARRVGYEPLRRAIGEQIGPHAEAAVKTLGEQLIHEGRVLGRKEGMAEGKAEGRAEGKAEAVLLFLRARLGEIPPDLSDTIRSTTSTNKLDRLTAVTATASSFDEIRAAMLA